MMLLCAAAVLLVALPQEGIVVVRVTVTTVKVVGFAVIHDGTKARTAPDVRNEPAQPEECQFYNLTSEFLEELKALQPKWYKNIAFMAQILYRVNISDPQSLEQFICRLTSLETLQDLQERLSNSKSRPEGYGRLVREYQQLQAKFGVIGGYTNIPRIMALAKDLRLWMMELPPEDSGPSEVVALDKLTDFFRVMQVKYGSRWLSLLAMSRNQMVLIEDPARMAKQLHDCRTADDVQRLLDIDSDPAELIFKYFLRYRSPKLKIDMHIFEIAAEIVLGLGQMGLYTLPY